MKTVICMAAGTIEANGKVCTIKAIDYEEVDGWVASKRAPDGQWTKWARGDGATVERWGGLGLRRRWCAFHPHERATPAKLLRDGRGRARTWATAEAARRAVDREFPVRALASIRAET